MITLSEKEFEKYKSIARVLGSALREIQELTDSVECGQHTDAKRRNLKKERYEKYQDRFRSGKMKRSKKVIK